jgi:FMN reductase (NADPH)
MSTATIKLIHKHGSVRKYLSDPVPENLVIEIVQSAQRAATSSNLQTYSVIATTDKNKKEILKVVCGGQKHISEAPLFLLWCADFSRLKRVCQHQGYKVDAGYVENFMVASVDAAIAMQNAALAAESLGLGFCYIGAVRNDPDKVREIFSLPDLVYPVAGMTVGYAENPPVIRPRLPIEAVLHWDNYQENDLDYLLAYDKEMANTGIYSGRQVGGDNQAPDQYGWMEHSARRVSKPSRPHLRETIKEAGFLLK